MRIGVIQSIEEQDTLFDKIKELGLTTCQLVSWDRSHCRKELAKNLSLQATQKGIQITGFWAGLPPPAVWDFIQGPITIGLVPPVYREERLQVLKEWVGFTKVLGTGAMITHCGFIPEDLTNPLYSEVVEAIRQVALWCKDNGIDFLLETGQETPVVLLRVIEDLQMDNVGINLDPANLILYGKGNPVDALDVIGKYVKQVHIKDGVYPITGRYLGREVPVGKGKVDFPVLLTRLYEELGFDGPLIIEREIQGPQQKQDILLTIQYLVDLLTERRIPVSL